MTSIPLAGKRQIGLHLAAIFIARRRDSHRTWALHSLAVRLARGVGAPEYRGFCSRKIFLLLSSHAAEAVRPFASAHRLQFARWRLQDRRAGGARRREQDVRL